MKSTQFNQSTPKTPKEYQTTHYKCEKTNQTCSYTCSEEGTTSTDCCSNKRKDTRKPVILLYNENEVMNNQEVSFHLTLNETMNIGSTYPHPTLSNENNKKKKEYEWNCHYSSNGNESCCQLIIDNKKFDYLFWEGQCTNEVSIQGERIGIECNEISEQLEVLLMKLGLNERERNDFIVYWLPQLSSMKKIQVTLWNDSYEKEVALLKVSGFEQIHRVMLVFEEIESIDNLMSVENVKERERPKGKYVIEWGATILRN